MENKKINILAVFGILFISSFLASGFAGAANISVSAPSNVPQGDTFTVEIVVDNVTNFAGAQFNLTFNSSVVQVINHSVGSITGSGHIINNTNNAEGYDKLIIPLNLNANFTSVINCSKNSQNISECNVSNGFNTWAVNCSNDRCNVTDYMTNYTFNGSGSVAVITFKVFGPLGSSSDLNLSDEILAGCTGCLINNSVEVQIPVENVNNATVTVRLLANITYTLSSSRISKSGTAVLYLNVNSPSGVNESMITLVFPHNLTILLVKVGTYGFIADSAYLQDENEHTWFNLNANGNNTGILRVPFKLLNPSAVEYGTKYTINLTALSLKDADNQTIPLNKELPLSLTIEVKCPAKRDVLDSLKSYFLDSNSPLCGGSACTKRNVLDVLKEYFKC